MTLLQALNKVATLQRGAALFVLGWLLVFGLVQLHRVRPFLHTVTKQLTPVLPWWLLGWAVCYAAAYLAYPLYADHVEASVVVLGEHLRSGLPLYPRELGHTMDGLLYGPLLAVLNSLSLSLPLDAFLGSKLLALLSSGVAVALCLTGLQDRRAWLYLGFLGAFDLAFFNRAEPHLLLLTALALRVARLNNEHQRAWLLGLLAGLAMSLKVHGVLYVAAVYLWVQPDWMQRPALLPRVAAGLLLGALPWFAVPGISLPSYLHFLQLASQHGIRPRIALDNAVFLIALWLPLLTLRQGATSAALPVALSWRTLISLAAMELPIALLLGAKQGAGCWHLMPFVLLHAQVLDALLRHRSLDTTPAATRPTALTLALLPLASLAISTAFGLAPGLWQHLKQRDDTQQARTELRQLSASHAGLLLATGRDRGYELSYLRIDLEQQGVRQIDVPAFIDLQWAGVSDAPLAAALRDCRIAHLAVPRGEPAFANVSNYSGRPLFSDAVRQAVAQRFTRVSQTPHFDLYRCQAPT